MRIAPDIGPRRSGDALKAEGEYETVAEELARTARGVAPRVQIDPTRVTVPGFSVHQDTGGTGGPTEAHLRSCACSTAPFPIERTTPRPQTPPHRQEGAPPLLGRPHVRGGLHLGRERFVDLAQPARD
jgi:hypothetical protein